MRGASAASSPEAAALALVSVANLALPRLPRGAFVPGSLVTAAAFVGLARRSGATWHELRMEPNALRGGAVSGVAVGTATAAAVLLLAATRTGRGVLVDRRVANARGSDVAYHLLLRIPFGTAVAEEVIFRAALPAIIARRAGRRAADAASAVLFGFWHVVDALEQLRTHPERARVSFDPARRAAVVATTVVVTAVAGLGFAALRDRARSVVAPVIVHAAVNATGFLAALTVAHRQRRMC